MRHVKKRLLEIQQAEALQLTLRPSGSLPFFRSHTVFKTDVLASPNVPRLYPVVLLVAYERAWRGGGRGNDRSVVMPQCVYTCPFRLTANATY